MTYLPLPPPPHSPANSVGKPYSNHIEVGVFSLTGSRLPDGQVGIIGTRGPHLMLGYIGFPPHNSTEFYMTNDLGYFHSPSSTFCFVGRASDTVRTGGETVVCAEVEREVTRLDLGLRECAVFGIDDLKSAMGEVRAGAKRQQKQDAICRSATAGALTKTPPLASLPTHPIARRFAPLPLTPVDIIQPLRPCVWFPRCRAFQLGAH